MVGLVSQIYVKKVDISGTKTQNNEFIFVKTQKSMSVAVEIDYIVWESCFVYLMLSSKHIRIGLVIER